LIDYFIKTKRIVNNSKGETLLKEMRDIKIESAIVGTTFHTKEVIINLFCYLISTCMNNKKKGFFISCVWACFKKWRHVWKQR